MEKKYIEIHNEIEKDINDVINKTIFYDFSNMPDWNIKDYQIKHIIGMILQKYRDNNKIHNYIVTSDYPNVKVLIKYNYYTEIDEIKILKFERLCKLQKINETSYES